jgi:hypothetical protein
MKQLFAFTIAFLASAPPNWADEITPPANERFVGESADQPDFRRHVVALMGRVGCNGRACHGSFQGRGGFRLSLFGYDFAADHEALTGGENPRADVKRPADSLLFYKSQRWKLAMKAASALRWEVGSTTSYDDGLKRDPWASSPTRPSWRR